MYGGLGELIEQEERPNLDIEQQECCIVEEMADQRNGNNEEVV